MIDMDGITEISTDISTDIADDAGGLDVRRGAVDRRRPPGSLAAAGVRHGVGPLTGERVLPVPGAVAPLFPEGGLVRGRTLACAGHAGRSLGLALVAPAIAAGAWLAVVDLDDLGAEAMTEAEGPLRRVVRIGVSGDGPDPARWAERVGAVLDGFEVVLLPDRRLPEGLWRRLVQRVRSSGAVVVVLAASEPALSVDSVLTAGGSAWVGIGPGAGRLLGRRVEVVRDGRRSPRRLATRLWLPHPSGRPLAAADAGVDTGADIDIDVMGPVGRWRRAV
jgi:hypothetical protein